MFRIIKQTNAKAVRSYHTSRAEYFIGGKQELPGIWGGKSAERLGLEGEVSKADFDAICENKNLATGGKLTARNRAGRIVGHDFNFHAPKSVSLALALLGEQGILTAFRWALDMTMAEMEMAMQTRVRKGGQMADRTTAEMLYSQHIHLTARPVDGVPDPHLHAHCFGFNATWDSVEDQWKASKIGDIYRDAPYYQAVFHAHLAHAVSELGFPLEKTATGWEIAGLANLVPKFSRRTAEIERYALEHGITDPVMKDGIGAKTRQRKCKDASMDELQRLWLARLDDGERQALAASAALPASPAPAVILDLAIADALTRGFAKGHALVPERHLVALALAEGLGTFTTEDIHRRLPKHGVVFRDYDGRRFCARIDHDQAEADRQEYHEQAVILRQRRAFRERQQAPIANPSPQKSPGRAYGR